MVCVQTKLWSCDAFCCNAVLTVICIYTFCRIVLLSHLGILLHSVFGTFLALSCEEHTAHLDWFINMHAMVFVEQKRPRIWGDIKVAAGVCPLLSLAGMPYPAPILSLTASCGSKATSLQPHVQGTKTVIKSAFLAQDCPNRCLVHYAACDQTSACPAL